MNAMKKLRAKVSEFTDTTSGTFASNYNVGEELGTGAFSVVKECTHKKTKESCAVKIIEAAELCKTDETALMDEIDILKQLRKHKHPNILMLYDVFKDSGHYYLVTEKLSGGELFDRVVEKECYSEKEARDTCKILLDAIQYCHSKKIVHRDLKPENLLLRSKENDTEIKLADFGLAKKVKKPNSLSTFCGTPGYTAPEVIEGKNYGIEVDMFSVGVIVYILLGGYPPFDEPDQTELYRMICEGEYEYSEEYWSEISQDAKDLIDGLLKTDPTERLTADDAMKNNWIRADDSDLNGDLGKNLEAFKRFNGKRKLRAAVKVVFASNRFKFLSSSALSAAMLAGSDSDDSDDEPEEKDTKKDNKMRASLVSVKEDKSLKEEDDPLQLSSHHQYYSVDQLRSQSVPGLDYKNREQYLSPEDFKAVLGMTREEFEELPKYRQSTLKWKAKLMEGESTTNAASRGGTRKLCVDPLTDSDDDEKEESAPAVTTKKTADENSVAATVDTSGHSESDSKVTGEDSDGSDGPYYTLKELKNMSVPGLDYEHSEKYLSPEDFKKHFNCTKEEFYELSTFRQNNKKVMVGLNRNLARAVVLTPSWHKNKDSKSKETDSKTPEKSKSSAVAAQPTVKATSSAPLPPKPAAASPKAASPKAPAKVVGPAPAPAKKVASPPASPVKASSPKVPAKAPVKISSPISPPKPPIKVASPPSTKKAIKATPPPPPKTASSPKVAKKVEADSKPPAPREKPQPAPTYTSRFSSMSDFAPAKEAVAEEEAIAERAKSPEKAPKPKVALQHSRYASMADITSARSTGSSNPDLLSTSYSERGGDKDDDDQSEASLDIEDDDKDEAPTISPKPSGFSGRTMSKSTFSGGSDHQSTTSPKPSYKSNVSSLSSASDHSPRRPPEGGKVSAFASRFSTVSDGNDNLSSSSEHGTRASTSSSPYNARFSSMSSISKKENKPAHYGGPFYSVQELRDMSIEGLDYQNREKYLSDEEFQEVLGCTKKEFAAMSKWKQGNAKRKAKLHSVSNKPAGSISSSSTPTMKGKSMRASMSDMPSVRTAARLAMQSLEPLNEDHSESHHDPELPSPAGGASNPPAKFRATMSDVPSMRNAAAQAIQEEEAAAAPAARSPAADTGGGGPYYSAEQLRASAIPGLDYTTREKYLSPSDFHAMFGCSKEAFAGFPRWKQTQMKRKLKLF